MKDLEHRGITEATLEAVASTDVDSSAELLARVRTAEDNQLLSKANKELEAKNAKLSNDNSLRGR